MEKLKRGDRVERIEDESERGRVISIINNAAYIYNSRDEWIGTTTLGPDGELSDFGGWKVSK